jgi:hypothetical protein
MNVSKSNTLAWPRATELVREFVSYCQSIADIDPVLHFQRGETLLISVADAAEERIAAEALRGLRVKFLRFATN